MVAAVSLAIDGAIARITLRRSDVGNAIDLALADELRRAVVEVEGDRSVRVVVVRGEGPHFCVGGDLGDFGNQDDLPSHLRAVTTHLHAAIAGLARLDAPVVVGVQGSSAGAGLGLVCSGDVVIAATSARFVVAYTKVGLSPDGGTSWFLPRLVGLRRAQELTLLNPTLDAEGALAAGIVTRVVADDDLDREIEAVASELAAGPTPAVGEAKRLLRTSLDNPLTIHLDAEAAALVRSAAREDAREGIAAFLAKRPSRFTGG